MKKRALITGISDQDGSYLAELLLEKVARFTGSYAGMRWRRRMHAYSD